MGWPWVRDSQTHTRLMDSLICITCSLENNAFSVLHYVMVASHYSMLHRLEIFSTPGTIAQIVLTKCIQCWAAVLCNNHSNYRSIEKRPSEISCKEQCLLLSTKIHFNTEENACLQWNATRQCLDLTLMATSRTVKVKTLEPTIHTRCKRNQLKLTPLSTPSLWKSSKTRTVYQTTSLLM